MILNSPWGDWGQIRIISLGSYFHEEQIPMTTVLPLQLFHFGFILIRKKFQCIQLSFSYIHLGLYLSGTTSSNRCSSSTASLDIFWVLHLWETYFNANFHPPTGISHISWVLYWLRTYSNPNDHLQTAISNNSQVLYRSGRNKYPGIWTPFKSSFTYLWVPKAVKDIFNALGFSTTVVPLVFFVLWWSAMYPVWNIKVQRYVFWYFATLN